MADAVCGTSDSALFADVAEVGDADVDWLVGNQREVGENSAGMNAGAILRRDHEAVSAKLAEASGNGQGDCIRRALKRPVSQFSQISAQIGLQDEVPRRAK